MQQGKRLIINVFSNYSALGIEGAVNFILAGYLVRKLGGDAFGVVSLVLSFTTITELWGNAFSVSLTKYLSFATNKGNAREVKRLVSTGFLCFIIFGWAGGLATYELSICLDNIFNIPSEYLLSAQKAVVLLAIRAVLCFPFNTLRAILFANQRYDMVNLAKIITIILRLIAIITCFELGHTKIELVILITLFSLIIERLIWYRIAKRVTNSINFDYKSLSWLSTKTFIGFSAGLVVVNIANLVGYEVVKWIIGIELGVSDVGGYTLVASLAVFVGSLTRAISGVLVPVASKYKALNLEETNKKLAILSTKYTVTLGCAICILPIFFYKPFLVFWVSDKYSPAYISYITLVGLLMLFGQWFISLEVSMRQMMVGLGNIRVPAIITVAWTFSGTVLAWVSLQWFDHSLLRVVIIVSISRMVGALAQMLYSLNILSISVIQLFAKSVFKPLQVTLLTLIVACFVAQHLDLYKLSNFIFGAGAVGFVYLILTYFITLETFERSAIITRLGSKLLKKNNTVR